MRYFVSGNKFKISEYINQKKILGEIKALSINIDFPEIESSSEVLVSLHKTKDMIGKIGLSEEDSFFSEDTSLQIEGYDIGTNIKKYSDQMNTFSGLNATWIVTIGLYENNLIHIYQGKINGIISKVKKGDSAFGFENYFIPEGSPDLMSLAQLVEIGKKDLFSARLEAIKSLKEEPLCSHSPLSIEKWKGSYQFEDQ